MTRPSSHGARALAALALCVLAGGCASAASHAIGSSAEQVALERYMAQVEPIRLAVNGLLEGADPILAAFRDRRIGRVAAARRMGALERRFARFTVEVAAIHPATATLRALHEEYAGTYVLEDAYLSALVTGLAGGELGDLPHTQDQQLASIIRWRTGLEVLAREARVALPTDLQQAGRGEIAPSPTGS